MKDYEIRKMDIVKNKKFYSILPIISVNDRLVWTGKFFSYVNVKLRKNKIRYNLFDEWNYTHYWSKWKYEWEFEELLK